MESRPKQLNLNQFNPPDTVGETLFLIPFNVLRQAVEIVGDVQFLSGWIIVGDDHSKTPSIRLRLEGSLR
jgi:hypothetical protein